MTLFDSLAGILAPIAFLGTGFIIQIDNKDYLAAGNNQISLLGHGVETNVNVERIYSNKLPHPYTACKIQLDSSNGFSSDLYLMFLANKARYTQKDCFSLCKQYNTFVPLNLLLKQRRQNCCFINKLLRYTITQMVARKTSSRFQSQDRSFIGWAARLAVLYNSAFSIGGWTILQWKVY